jgi:hypothetical protein
MYAVVHGGVDRALRQESIDYLTSLPFDGFALGGSFGKLGNELAAIVGFMSPEVWVFVPLLGTRYGWTGALVLSRHATSLSSYICNLSREPHGNKEESKCILRTCPLSSPRILRGTSSALPTYPPSSDASRTASTPSTLRFRPAMAAMATSSRVTLPSRIQLQLLLQVRAQVRTHLQVQRQLQVCQRPLTSAKVSGPITTSRSRHTCHIREPTSTTSSRPRSRSLRCSARNTTFASCRISWRAFAAASSTAGCVSMARWVALADLRVSIVDWRLSVASATENTRRLHLQQRTRAGCSLPMPMLYCYVRSSETIARGREGARDFTIERVRPLGPGVWGLEVRV